MDKHSAVVLCLCGLVMFLVGKLPTVLQHVQHPLMYNLEHACAHMLLLWVEDVECRKEARIMASKAQCFAEATQCRHTRRRSR